MLRLSAGNRIRTLVRAMQTMRLKPPPSKQAVPSSDPSGFDWLVAGAGVSTLMLVSGYVVVMARQTLLGLELHGFEPSVYTSESSRLILDTTVMVVRLASEQGSLVMGARFAGILLLIAGIDALQRRTAKGKSASVREAILRFMPALLAIAAAWQIYAMHVPALYLSDALFRDYSPEYTDAPPSVIAAVQAVWTDLNCQRNPNANVCSSLTGSHEARSGAFFEQHIRMRFVLSALLLGCLVSIAFLIRRHTVQSVVTYGAAVILALDALSLVYVYGVTIRTTVFPMAIVVFSSDESCIPLCRPQAASLVFGDHGSKPASGGTSAANAQANCVTPINRTKPEDKTFLYQLRALLLAERPDELVIYHEECHRVWRIPRRNVSSVRFEGRKDVLASHWGG